MTHDRDNSAISTAIEQIIENVLATNRFVRF